MPVVYVANGLGFGELCRTRVLTAVVGELQRLGIYTIEPFADNNEASLSSERGVEREHDIARRDIRGVKDSDAVLCVVSSPIPDEGAMIEVGMAMAWNKPVFILNDDFRFADKAEGFPMNLMLFGKMPLHEWSDYYYTSLSQLSDPTKALVRWRNSFQPGCPIQ